MRPKPPPSATPTAEVGWTSLVRRALAEDRAHRDRTTRALLPEPGPATARVIAQDEGVLSGSTVAAAVARALGLAVTPLAQDGERIRRGQAVLRIDGDARAILAAERTLLNLLMHLSGVASATALAVRRASGPGHRLAIYATRKTLPGLRDLEKAAVVHGGGHPHRRDLSDGLLLKNNHLALVPLADAVARLKAGAGRPRSLQVEVRDARSALAAVRAGADALLIDNAPPAQVRGILRDLEAHGRRKGVWVEVSGGITPESVGRYRTSGADAASLGALTHSARALPFHLRLRPVRRRRVRPDALRVARP